MCVAIGVTQLLEEGVDPLHQAVIARHHLLNAGVAFVDADIHIGAVQVGLEGLGFDHGHGGMASCWPCYRGGPARRNYPAGTALLFCLPRYQRAGWFSSNANRIGG